MSKLASFYTIPISHYGERARWALDMSDVAYEEHHHLQMFSWVVALGLGGRKFLPVLATSGETINDSGQIMRWAAGHRAALYPTDDSLDRELAEVYGVATRRATMTAPAVMPQRYGVPMPELDELPPDAAARVREARAHPAGAFAMRLYDERPRVRARYVRELVSDTLRARESARTAR